MNRQVIIMREPVYWPEARQQAHAIYPISGPRTPATKLGEQIGSIDDRATIEAATVALAQRLGYTVAAVCEPLELPGFTEVW